MPEPRKKSTRAIEELIAEVQDIRVLLEKIEKRTIYLRPDGVLKSAGKQIASGVLRGLGVLVGGVLFLIIFGFVVQRVLTSDAVQSYIGAQIQSAVTGAIDKQLDALPWR